MKNAVFDWFLACFGAFLGISLGAWEARFWLWNIEMQTIWFFIAMLLFTVLRLSTVE